MELKRDSKGRFIKGFGGTVANKGAGQFKKGHKGFLKKPNKTSFKKGQIPWNKGLKGYQAGETHYCWKGGITPLNEKARKSPEYKKWRQAVFERDNYTCQECGKRGSTELHADHIKPFAYFEELRFEVANGRTLCKSCHRKTETYGYKVRRKYE